MEWFKHYGSYVLNIVMWNYVLFKVKSEFVNGILYCDAQLLSEQTSVLFILKVSWERL